MHDTNREASKILSTDEDTLQHMSLSVSHRSTKSTMAQYSYITQKGLTRFESQLTKGDTHETLIWPQAMSTNYPRSVIHHLASSTHWELHSLGWLSLWALSIPVQDMQTDFFLLKNKNIPGVQLIWTFCQQTTLVQYDTTNIEDLLSTSTSPFWWSMHLHLS